MMTALRREEIDEEDSAPKRVMLPKKSVQDFQVQGPSPSPRSKKSVQDLEDFVNGRTLHFFRKLHLDTAFLDLPQDSRQMVLSDRLEPRCGE